MDGRESFKLDHERIAREREAQGWTLEEAARRAGMLTSGGLGRRAQWWDIESGKRPNLSAVTLYQIASALRRPMELFIVPAGAKPKPAPKPKTRKAKP